MKITIILFLLIIAHSDIYSQDISNDRWTFFSGDEETNFYADKSSIIVNNGAIQIWIKMVVKQSNNSEYMLNLLEFDCNQHNSHKNLSRKIYINGELTHSEDYTKTEYIVPESLMDGLYKMLAKKYCN